MGRLMNKEDWTPRTMAFANHLARESRRISDEAGTPIQDVDVDAIVEKAVAEDPSLLVEETACDYDPSAPGW
jgi:hypothetical protein